MFYKHFFSKGIEYTEDLFYEKTNIDPINAVRGERLLNPIFLTWTGLRDYKEGRIESKYCMHEVKIR